MRLIARALVGAMLSLVLLHAGVAKAEPPAAPPVLADRASTSEPSGAPMHRRPALAVLGGVLVFSATFLSFWGFERLALDLTEDPINCGSDSAKGVLGARYGRMNGICGYRIDTEKQSMGIGLLVGAGASLALGVPLIVLGAKEVPDDHEAPPSFGRLSIGARPLPGGAGVGVFGSF